MLPSRRSVCIVLLSTLAAATVFSQAKPSAKDWTPPKTAWGEPNLQGVWTSDDSFGVPFERPRAYGNRRLLTHEEFAERQTVIMPLLAGALSLR